MPKPPNEAAEQIRELSEAGARGDLIRRGLARAMIWREGQLPEGAPRFSTTLTSDLLDHGYALLAECLTLREVEPDDDRLTTGFRVAAEAIESAVRRGPRDDPDRGFHLIVAAIGFHLAGLSARSYCLIPESAQQNLSSKEQVLAALVRRKLDRLRHLASQWLEDPTHTDEYVAERLSTDPGEGDDFMLDDAVAVALTRQFMESIGLFDFALQTGHEDYRREAVGRLHRVSDAAMDARGVPHWWSSTLAWHLLDEIWDKSLHRRLPAPQDPGLTLWRELRARFIAVLTARTVAEIDLWPSQLEAAQRAVDPGDDLVVALPTSAGKTRIAELCILRTLSAERRVVYVTPLRALSAQIERGLAQVFGPLGFSVSSLYGASGVTVADVGTLQSFDIVVATPEKLDFSLRQEPDVIDDVGLIVLDEGHMIGEGTREVRYEVLVQRLLRRPDANQRRLVCLSAVFDSGESFDDFTAWLRSDDPGDPIALDWRPTRQRTAILEWRGDRGHLALEVDGEEPYVPRFVREQPPKGKRRNPYPQNAQELVVATATALIADGHRVLIYCPQRRSVESLANTCLTLARQGYLDSFVDDPDALTAATGIAEEWLGSEHVATRALVELGIAVHHGALPRPFQAAVEQLVQGRVLPLVIASPTVAQGLDLSCSALVFRSLYRFNSNRGRSEAIEAKEFANVIGRAGRAYVDLDGLTVYPIYQGGRQRQRKIRQFEQLRAQARAREMESGLVLLVRRLASLLAQRLGVDENHLLDHVTNFGRVWTDIGPAVDGENGSDEVTPTSEADERLLADLDTAVLAAVEDPDCPVEDLTAALDRALDSSLWRRRLRRLSDAEQELQEAILTSRAEWVWRATTAGERRAFFAAGVGYAAGRHLDDHIDDMVAAVVESDARLAEGQVEDAILAATRVATVLSSTHPFSYELPDGWEEVLAGWMRGTPVARLIGMTDGDEVEMIQDAFVYRLVWGVEAVRVHGLALDVEEADGITGQTAICLTYGLPSREACLLAQAGLPSRSMALRLLDAFPGMFETGTGLGRWLAEIRDAVSAEFWPDEASAELWEMFSSPTRREMIDRWTESEMELQVRWDLEATPAPGSDVRIQYVPERRRTFVLGPDLTRLGQTAAPWSPDTPAYVRATVGADGTTVKITRFGPRPQA